MSQMSELTSSQDTAVHAMTEVALGLSMAFFALLIIALISISLPSTPVEIAIHPEPQLILAKQTQQASDKLSQDVANSADDAPFIVLYWEGQYVDVNMQNLTLGAIEQQSNLVIAIDAEIPFSQLLTIQSHFKGQEMRLTTLSDEWKRALHEN